MLDLNDSGFIPPILKIRAVYQQNCFASHLNDAWLSLGADVVSGAQELNSMPMGYATFLNRWLTGQTFESAVIGGYEDNIPAYSLAFTLLGKAGQLTSILQDSHPVVVGDRSLRLND